MPIPILLASAVVHALLIVSLLGAFNKPVLQSPARGLKFHLGSAETGNADESSRPAAHMSEYRVEKRREAAELTLVTGSVLSGVFFLAGSSHLHTGPERVGDVLNLEPGFFPFETGAATMLINRAHVLKVALPPQMIEAQLDAGYDVATRRTVCVLLTTGETVTGEVVVFRPPGRDRLSDYAHIEERFRYVELQERTLLINSAHIVAFTEVTN